MIISILYTFLIVCSSFTNSSQQHQIYKLPMGAELEKKYRIQDKNLEKLARSIINKYFVIVNATAKQCQDTCSIAKYYDLVINALQQAGFRSIKGAAVMEHIKLKNYVLKFGIGYDRIEGLELLKRECDQDPECPLIFPKKFLTKSLTYTTHVVLAEKMSFMQRHSDEINHFLINNQHKLQQAKTFLYKLGFCDGHGGNIKITKDGQFALVDTDFRQFTKPHNNCGWTSETTIYDLGYCNKTVPALCTEQPESW